ncbi:uncharacterized protein [Rutidosis leptorrhynchoides]|uniref:uncharacterized protein n=2 Tax=Rutidosis leptorrhynchoides TaxID=125765 RepID=UPI003A99852D
MTFASLRPFVFTNITSFQDDCPKRKRPFRSLHPSETERGCQWWIQSSSYFQGDVVEDEKNTQDDNQVEEELGGSLKELLQEESEQTSDPHPTQKGNKLQELLRMVNMLTKRVDDQEKELADCKKKLDDHEKRLKEQEHQEHQYVDNEDAYVDPRSFSDNDTSPRVVRRGKRERRPTHFLNSPFTTPGYRKPLEKLSDEVASRVKRLKVSHQGTKEVENVLPMETEKPTEKGAEKAVDKQDENVALVSEEIEQGVDLPLVNEAEKQADQHDKKERKRKRKEKDWVGEEEIWSMVDKFINDQGTLQPPPPSAWRDQRKHVGPAKDLKSLILNKQDTRCMFIFQNETFLFLDTEFWKRLLGIAFSGYLENIHIDGWATFLLRFRQRFLPRASQMSSSPQFPIADYTCSSRWTIMPLGFLNQLEKFKSFYDDDTQNEEEKRDTSNPEAEGIIKFNPPDYMYLIGLGDGSDDLYPSWAECDKILIPVHFSDPEHFILLTLNLDEQRVLVYDSLKGCLKKGQLEAVFKNLSDNLPLYLKAIDYFNKKQDSQIVDYYENREDVELMIEDAPYVPMQSGGHGDCGVWVCLHMERIVFGWDQIDNIGDPKKAAKDYRIRMARTFFRARFDTQEPPPPEDPEDPKVVN